jgi:hypothetical protein
LVRLLRANEVELVAHFDERAVILMNYDFGVKVDLLRAASDLEFPRFLAYTIPRV